MSGNSGTNIWTVLTRWQRSRRSQGSVGFLIRVDTRSHGEKGLGKSCVIVHKEHN